MKRHIHLSRRWQEEKEAQLMLWKVDHSDIEFSSKARGSVSTQTTSVNGNDVESG